jgi:hypothetical protein
MNRPQSRIAGLATAFVLAALGVVFGPGALARCPVPSPAARAAVATGAAGLVILRFLFRRADRPGADRPEVDLARRWRELDRLRELLEARDDVPAGVRAMLDHAYDYLIIGREPGAAAWSARQVEAWLAHH